MELDRKVETGLTSERRQQRVRPLTRDDRIQGSGRQRLQVHDVGDFRVGHDRRGVRIDEDDALAFLAQRATRLHAGIVELRRLADDDRP